MTMIFQVLDASSDVHFVNLQPRIEKQINCLETIGAHLQFEKSCHGLNIEDDLEQKISKFSKEQKSRRFHLIMKTTLESFVSVQKQGGFHQTSAQLGGVKKTVDIKVPCGLLLGDMQGGNKPCGSSISYSAHQSRFCWQCDCPG